MRTSNHESMENNDLNWNNNSFLHYVLWQDIFQPMHTLSTAIYVSVNNVIVIVDKVRPHIFSVYWINSQANTDFLFRKSHKQPI